MQKKVIMWKSGKIFIRGIEREKLRNIISLPAHIYDKVINAKNL